MELTFQEWFHFAIIPYTWLYVQQLEAEYIFWLILYQGSDNMKHVTPQLK